mmetsp:Transcript_64230/g.114030  ORF Transcript_64230/g.114030 Transcript_64230/m.114030 type:complete len:572 (+) Transcript_64230:86-1801(+)
MTSTKLEECQPLTGEVLDHQQVQLSSIEVQSQLCKNEALCAELSCRFCKFEAVCAEWSCRLGETEDRWENAHQELREEVAQIRQAFAARFSKDVPGQRLVASPSRPTSNGDTGTFEELRQLVNDTRSQTEFLTMSLADARKEYQTRLSKYEIEDMDVELRDELASRASDIAATLRAELQADVQARVAAAEQYAIDSLKHSFGDGVQTALNDVALQVQKLQTAAVTSSSLAERVANLEKQLTDTSCLVTSLATRALEGKQSDAVEAITNAIQEQSTKVSSHTKEAVELAIRGAFSGRYPVGALASTLSDNDGYVDGTRQSVSTTLCATSEGSTETSLRQQELPWALPVEGVSSGTCAVNVAHQFSHQSWQHAMQAGGSSEDKELSASTVERAIVRTASPPGRQSGESARSLKSPVVTGRSLLATASLAPMAEVRRHGLSVEAAPQQISETTPRHHRSSFGIPSSGFAAAAQMTPRVTRQISAPVPVSAEMTSNGGSKDPLLWADASQKKVQALPRGASGMQSPAPSPFAGPSLQVVRVGARARMPSSPKPSNGALSPRVRMPASPNPSGNRL